jgi:outer membrane receptor protein involved in Fe transport
VFKSPVIFTISLSSAVLATSALAQEADQPDIIVTAPLGSDRISVRESPSNAQVLTGDALTRQGHADLANLLNANVGSVSLSNSSGSPYQSDVSYRGFQATSLLGSPTGLSVYLDGVRMNEPFGSVVNWDLIPLNAISAIEVLPGSNPVFGLNTLGGALVLRTKDGAKNRGASIMAQIGSFHRRSAQLEAGGQLGAADAIDWFVSGNYDKQDGYRQHTNTMVKQFYSKLRWHEGERHIELGTIWSDTSLSGTQGLPLSMLSHPKIAYTWPDNIANRQLILNVKGEAPLARALRASGNLYYRHSNAYSTNSNASLSDECSDEARDCGASAPNGTALDLYTNNPFGAGIPEYENFTPFDGGLPIHDYTSNIETSIVRSATRQSTLGGNGLLDADYSLFGMDNDLNVGGSFESAKIDYSQSTGLAYLVGYQAVPMPWNFKYGSSAGFKGQPQISAVTVASHSGSFDLFARDTLKLTPSFALSGSVSYTFSRVALNGLRSRLLADNGDFSWTGNDGLTYFNPSYVGASYFATSAIDGAVPGSFLATVEPPARSISGPEESPVTGSHNYHRLNPSVGFTWNPSKATGLFGNFSEAMRAPTAIELACADPATPCALPTGFNGDPGLKAVVAHTIEAGARGSIGRVSWNAAAYRSLLDNDIEFIFDSSGLGYFSNVGKTERRGFEAGVSADVSKTHLSASYGYARATYLSSFIDAEGNAVRPGSRIPGIPRQSLKLRAVYDPIKTLAFGASFIATSSQYSHGDEANREQPLPGYAIVNVDAHFMPVRALELFANINNLLDRRYATFGLMGTNIYTGKGEQFRTPAPGRTALVGLRYRFGPQSNR